MFVCVFEKYTDQEFGESYAAGLYDVNRLGDRWDRDLTVQEIETERKNITVFNGSNGNPFMNMLKYLSEYYEGDERTFIDKDGDEIVSLYRFFWLRTILADLIVGLY